MTFTAAWFKDAAERIVTSFLEAVLAVVVSGGVSQLNASTLHVLLIAGLTAAFATVKTLLAATKTGTVSPASLAATPAATPRKRAHRQAGYGEIGILLRALIAIALVLLLVWVIFVVVSHLAHVH